VVLVAPWFHRPRRVRRPPRPAEGEVSE